MLLTGKNKNQKIILSKDILKSATTNQISNAYLPYEIKNFDVEKLEYKFLDRKSNLILIEEKN